MEESFVGFMVGFHRGLYWILWLIGFTIPIFATMFSLFLGLGFISFCINSTRAALAKKQFMKNSIHLVPADE